MPSWAIHLLTAKRLSNKIDVDKNIFLIGNLLTDLLNGYVIKEVSSHVLHSETHFDTMTVFDGKKSKRPDLVGFKKKYGKYFLNNPLILGYYTHLATDYFWNSKTYDEYGIFNEEGKRIGVKLNNGKEKICQKEEIRKLKTNDFKIFSAHIYEKEMIEKIYWDDNIMTYLKQFDWIKFEKTDIEKLITYINKHIDKKNLSFEGKEKGYSIYTEELIDSNINICVNKIKKQIKA